MKLKKALQVLASILVVWAVGIVGSIATRSSLNTWYLTINKPVFNPPGWLFGPVWTVLYTMMGIALYLIWKSSKDDKNRKTALILFGIQLLLNGAWSFLFFGLQNPFFAFINIVILWFFIVLSIYYFYKISKTASFLLLPYIAWSSFAAVLNFFLWRMNLP
ncbi:TspO/MBR family protein [Spirochaetota bacterium]